MKYRGEYVCTIQPSDIGKANLILKKTCSCGGKRIIPLYGFMGLVQVCDVGKQIWNQDGVYCVESQEQVETRMMHRT
jgi:hypothetical protein